MQVGYAFNIPICMCVPLSRLWKVNLTNKFNLASDVTDKLRQTPMFIYMNDINKMNDILYKKNGYFFS